MAPPILSDLELKQAHVAYLLALGKSVTEASTTAKVGRTTIYTWIKTDLAFAREVEHSRQTFADTLRDQLRDASIKALATITAIMDDPKAPAGVRLKAALAILNRPQFPNQGWALPEKIEDPAKEAFRDSMADLEAMDRHRKLTERNKTEHIFPFSSALAAPLPQTGTAAAAEQNGTLRNTSEQKIGKMPGRNSPCPCNSGKKYKFCCRNRQHTALETAA